MEMKPDTLKFILGTFEKGTKILELGSGGTTKTLLEAGFIMFSIEQDPDYAFKYHDDYLLCPLKKNESTGSWWFDREVIENANIPTDYDLLLIDGPTGPPRREFDDCRLGVLDNLDLFNTDVPILVDDTDRKEELKIFNILKKGRESHCYPEFGIIW